MIKRPFNIVIIAIAMAVALFLLFLAESDFDFIKSSPSYPVPFEIISALPAGHEDIMVNIGDPNITSVGYYKEFDEVLNRVNELKGTYGIYIKDFSNNKIYEYNATREFYGASLYKTPLAVAVLKSIQDKELGLDTPITYQKADSFSGTGYISQSSFGASFTVEQVLVALMKASDNTAQAMLFRTLPYQKIKDSYVTLTGNPNSKYLDENITTPEEVGTTLSNMYKSDYLTYDTKKYLLGLMTDTDFDDRISPHIAEPQYFAHKIGNWGEEGTWHDCGIVYGSYNEFVVCLMSEGTSYEDFLVAGKVVGEFINIASGK